ncbi:MAG: Cobyrinic acid a,c-diamide synthase, partial [Clostridia bacterium 62_21]
EGPGCYCYANNILRRLIDQLSGAYRAVVLDNEAGLEHLSRRTAGCADALVVVSDSTVRGVRSAHRIANLARELDLPIGSYYLVVNKVVPGSAEALQGEIDRTGLTLLGSVPYDPAVTAWDLAGSPLTTLPETSPASAAVGAIVEKLIERCRSPKW